MLISNGACCCWIHVIVREALGPLAILALSVVPRACGMENQCGGGGRVFSVRPFMCAVQHAAPVAGLPTVLTGG